MAEVVNNKRANTCNGPSKTAGTSFTGVRRIRGLLGTMFALIVADGLITNYLMVQGLGTEWNPFLQALAGQEHFLAIKIAGALISALILWDIYRKRPQLAIISTLFIVVLYMGIVYWNIFSFFIARA